ncbi:uncharacterized protein [Chamaea fasciata]|uniref:uncharacterized protein isoform X6 n=1 Tax=Chamaea fasciata TaxID=190680 RepID=UPI00336AAED4
MRAVTSLPTVAKMAARRVLRLAERQARAARPWPRPPQRIGEWRERRAPLPPLARAAPAAPREPRAGAPGSDPEPLPGGHQVSRDPSSNQYGQEFWPG